MKSLSETNSAPDLQLLFESIPELYIILSPDLQVVAVSNAYLKATMRTREEILGKYIFDVFPENPADKEPNEANNVLASFERVLKERRPVTMPIQQYDVRRPESSGGEFEERYWNLQSTPILNDQGAVRYIIHRVEDVTEQEGLKRQEQAKFIENADLRLHLEQIEGQRRQAAIALEDVNLRLEAALEAGEIGTWIWDIVNNRVVADKNLAKFFSVSPEDAAGGLIENYIRAIHPEDREQVSNQINNALSSDAVAYEAEYRLTQPDGSTRSVVARGSIVRDENGNPFQLPGVVIDITDRKKADEAREKSEEQLRLALQATDLGLWDFNSQTGYFDSTPRFREIFGLPAEAKMTARDLNDALHPEDRLQVAAAIAQALNPNGNGKFEMDYRIIQPATKAVRWVHAVGQAQFESLGEERQANRFIGTFADITERKEAAEELRESRTRLRFAFESANIGDWDLDLITGKAQRSFLHDKCFGATEPFLDWSYETFLSYVHPEDRADVELKFSQALSSEQKEWHFECRVIWADKSVHWIEAHGRVYRTVNESPVRMLGIITDTTERNQAEQILRESEERFRDMADNISQLAWMADGKGSIFWYNQRWFDYTGTTLEEMQGWGWRKVYHPEYIERVTTHFRQSIEAGTEWEDTFPLRSKKGEYCWFLSRALPIRDEQGNIVRWFGTNTDITESKNAEAEREQLLQSEQEARRNAETASRLKDEFLATVSHELRTPLNAILGWATMLQNKSLDVTIAAKALATIERNARSQAQLIEDLLDVSRIITGNLRLDVREIDPLSFIEAALEAIRPATESKDIRLQTILDGRIPSISGDSSRLQQVVWNLLSNAIKFTHKGGRVQLKLERVDSHVEISISDNGEGIAPEFLPFVFDRFRQADGTSTRRHGGLGLGLSIVRQLIELHGGTVHVYSEGEKRGSIFTVKLPLLPVYKNSELGKRIHPAANDFEPATNFAEKLDGVKILIVDDELDSVELIKTVLSERGAEVLGATSVKQALMLIQQSKPDVLISDIGMPEEDGYELIRKLRLLPSAEGGKIPAIALTAYARIEDRLKALRAGFEMYISKPVEIDELLAVILSLIRRTSVN